MTVDATDRGDLAGIESEPNFDVLYGRYHEFVRAALRKHYIDPTELEDVTQEVFIVLLRRIDEARRKQSLGAWLFQIVRRVAANHRRGRQRRTRKHAELEAFPGEVSDAGPDPVEAVARSEAWGFIRRFFESLDDEACAVFVMSEVEGLPGTEVAARLGLTLPRAYARIRAVRGLFSQRVARERGLLAGAIGLLETIVALRSVGWRLAIGVAVAAFAVMMLWAATRGGGGRQGPTPPVAVDDVRERVAAIATSGSDGADASGDDSATASFAGVVVDPDGTPIEGAVVCGDRKSGEDHFLIDPPACGRSDAEGRFRVTTDSARVHVLEAMHADRIPGYFRGAPSKNIRIVLRPGGVPLSGVVVDVYGGPVEGAWVAVENRREETLGATMHTDTEGRFSLWVVEGPVSLAAGAADYATTYTMAHAPSRQTRIELGAESILSGVAVEGKTGAPAAGVRILAGLLGGADKYSNRQGLTHTDANGRWEIRGLQPGHYVMDAAGERSWGRAAEAIDLGIADQRRDIRIEMIAGTEIVGRIVDADTGEPCSEGSASTNDEGQSIWRAGTVRDDGVATVGPLTGNERYRITVACVGYEARLFDVDLRDGPSAQQEWPLTRGGELTVRVVDEQGNALPDWTVALTRRWRRDLDVAWGREELTDTDGTVVFAGLPAGPQRLSARGPGLAPIVGREVNIDAARMEIELRAVPGASVTGTVVNDAGRPVVGALVVLGPATTTEVHAWTPEPEVWAPNYEAVTDAAGRFMNASVAAGEYGIWVLAPERTIGHLRPVVVPGGFRPMTGAPLRTVSIGEDGAELQLELGEMRSISGTVRDEDGDLVADVRVFAAQEGERDLLGPSGRPSLTGTEGQYTVDGLPEGAFTLTAYRPRGGVVRKTGVHAGTNGVDLVFPRRGSISGHVHTPDGSPAVAYTLEVNGGDLPHRPAVLVGAADGRFAVGDLEAGRYRLLASSPLGLAEVTVELEPGSVRSGIVIALEGRTRVEGRLVNADGAPQPDWVVALVDPGEVRAMENVHARWRVDQDGTFVFRDCPDRTLVLRAMPAIGTPPPPELVNEAQAVATIVPERGKVVDLGDLPVVSP
jgi:RNA polymerase sigma-70 factor (ECF subfamily)